MDPPPPPHQLEISQNPNLLFPHERPPPPLHDNEPTPSTPNHHQPIGILANGPHLGASIPLAQAQHPPAYAPFPPAMNPMMGMPMGGMPMGMGGMGMPMPMGMGMMGMPGFGQTPPWMPPAPERNSGVSPLPGWGVGGFAGAVPPGPFAGGMGMGLGMGMMGGMGMGGMGCMPMGMNMPVPPPPFVDGPNGARAPQPQNDPTVKPGGDIPGCTVLQPAENVEIRRFITNAYPWETAGAHLHVERVQADAGWTVGRLIGMLRKPNKECQGWAISECIELGGGRFAKGCTFVFGSHQATEQTLSGIGWTQDRNREGGSPLYVYLHRV